MTKKKKIGILIGTSILLILVIASIIFFWPKDSQTQSVEVIEPVEMLPTTLPNIIEEEIECNISTTEQTSENVVVSIISKEKEYPIYYAIMEINQAEQGEETPQEEIPNEDYCLYEKEIIVERNSVIFFKYKWEEEYSEIPYKIEITNIVVEEEPEEEEESVSEEELKKAQVDQKEKKNNTAPYYIKVNYGANVVTVYKKDENDEYTIPVKAMVCSCGTATPTSGVYKISNRYTWRVLVGGVYGQYATRIVGSILFHSVPYTARSNDTLEYWEYDKLGTKASAGCVRLTVIDASWIYHNCPSGTMVEFYSSSDPGPLGKPSSKKITQYEQWRNWDPTDPASGNPWNSATIPEEKKTETTGNTENTTSKEEVTEKKPEKENTVQNNTSTSNVGNNTTVENTNNTVKEENNTTNTTSSKENTTNTTSSKKENTVSQNNVNNVITDSNKKNTENDITKTINAI